MTIKFKRLHDDAVLPTKGSMEAACHDLVITQIDHPDGQGTMIVKYGFSTEIEKGYKAVIVPRSSFTLKGWVMQNSPGQIDSDYRGEWMTKFEAIPQSIGVTYAVKDPFHKYSLFPYKIGDRVTQCYIEKVIDVKWEETKELEITERGAGGFGSTNN